MLNQVAVLSIVTLLGGYFGTRSAPPADPYQRSRVLSFHLDAIMDTSTAILDGRVVGICNQQPLRASVQLTTSGKTYRTVAAPDGKFRFFHIRAGDYLITATCPAYGKLAADTVHLGTGDAATITIGLGCRITDSR